MPEIRKAQENDVALILDFIKGIADYEKLLHEVKATPELLKEWIFERKAAEVAFVMDKGKEVGFVLYFHNFSVYQYSTLRITNQDSVQDHSSC